jgi:uncharacterized protein (TIGR02145 family)
MRKTALYLIVASILLSNNAASEDIVLTFSATGQSDKIDSITATNLAINQSITLPGNAQLILKDTLITSVNITDNFQHPYAYPNPFVNKTTIEFNSEEQQNIAISVSTVTGQIINYASFKIKNGKNSISLSNNDEGVYLVSIIYSNKTECLKLIQDGKGIKKIEILETNPKQINNYSNFQESQRSLANTNQNNKFQLYYSPGNIILFNFKSGIYKTIVTASPSASASIVPEFVSCSDYDNFSYPVVKIGTQTWMGQNLKSKHYSNGDSIPYIIEDTVWVNLKKGACTAFLNYEPCVPYIGQLYNWFAVNDKRGICPTGWHVSSSADWDTLLNYLGGAEVAGGKLKTTGIDYTTTFDLDIRDWKAPNIGATNSSGFSAGPGGSRNTDGRLYNQGINCFYWLADERDSYYAYNRYIWYKRTLVSKVFHTKADGFVVRCVKDK